jgi:hypothetical protein
VTVHCLDRTPGCAPWLRQVLAANGLGEHDTVHSVRELSTIMLFCTDCSGPARARLTPSGPVRRGAPVRATPGMQAEFAPACTDT